MDCEPEVSVVIVSWNAKHFVFDCLRSLEATREISLEVIVVDNGSLDGTPRMIKDHFPHVKLIELTANCGFARGTNIGISQSRGKYLFLINSDVTVPPGCIKTIRDYMEACPSIGLLGPQMRGSDGEVRRSTMRFPTILNSFLRAVALDNLFGRMKGVHGVLMTDFDHARTTDVEVLNGWFWAVRRRAMEEVGLLDERFFMYGEDIDWCRRFHNAGWRTVFYSGAAATHYGGASSNAAPTRFYIELHRAHLQYWRKHHRRATYMVYSAVTLLHHCIRVVGYACAYLVRPNARDSAFYKMTRSGTMLGWLAGLTRLPIQRTP